MKSCVWVTGGDNINQKITILQMRRNGSSLMSSLLYNGQGYTRFLSKYQIAHSVLNQCKEAKL